MIMSVTSSNIASRIKIEISNPSALTCTASPPYTMENSNQGTGRPTKISNKLLPTEEDTAISPSPFFATITEDNKSGIEVPAAKKVRPITTSGICSVSPTIEVHSTRKYEKTPTHKMEIKKDA
mmetsp:Transcript_68541/g.108848  ORF Transcript_68541/g.108848 Transcript_68541/m.108848 type:complete len:123 (-) Transcript_68541:316-684(-)